MRAQVSTTATSEGYQGFFLKDFMGVVTVPTAGSDKLATLEVNYYAWTSCCHGQRQWALDLSELLLNFNLHCQQALTDCSFYLLCLRMNTILVGKGGK